jgi:hypothetical protein
VEEYVNTAKLMEFADITTTPSASASHDNGKIPSNFRSFFKADCATSDCEECGFCGMIAKGR